MSNDDLQSYRVEVGEYHGAEKRDLVGAIANEIGLDPKFIGKIRMFKDHSFIDLPKDAQGGFRGLKTVWVQGHQLNLSIDRGPRPGGKGGKFGGKEEASARVEDSAKVEANQEAKTAIVISARNLRESFGNK